ncbi:helix-turn-helix domain-containing protein [Patescibacteria group bacterium]|nr:helix-turn-helix domain-containing protein [Patescibacteria group bacterium]
MLWNEEQRQALGIKKKEQRLLDVLHKKGTLNTMELAFEAKVPRVTVMRLLKNLKERGFVARQTLLNEVRWSLVRPELLVKRIEKTFSNMPGNSKNTLPLSDIASVHVYRGPHELLESNKKLFAAHPGERIYSIEPNGVWRHIAKVPAQDWVHLNKLLKQKKIIVELLIEEGYESYFKSIERPLQESFFALVGETYIFPKNLMRSSTEVLIFRDSALFLDWEQFVAVEIKNSSTVAMFKGMFSLLKSHSRRM